MRTFSLTVAFCAIALPAAAQIQMPSYNTQPIPFNPVPMPAPFAPPAEAQLLPSTPLQMPSVVGSAPPPVYPYYPPTPNFNYPYNNH